MSFWSSFNLVRSSSPPILTAAEICKFVNQLMMRGALECDENPRCKLKFGSLVDQDDKSTEIMTWSENGSIGTPEDYPWDVSEEYSSIGEMCGALSHEQRTVYRAYTSLGSAHESIVKALTREPCEENETGMCLSNVNFEVGPILVENLESEAAMFAGWMSLSFSGYGYFFPWDFRQVRDRLEELEVIQRIVSLCKSTWPVPVKKPTANIMKIRKKHPKHWLYDDFNLSPDWFWFAKES